MITVDSQENKKNYYLKTFNSKDKKTAHLQVIKCCKDGNFYVTNFHLKNGKLNQLLKNGQITYDLSDKSAVQNAPDNNIINDNSKNFNPTTYKQEILPSEEKLIAGYTYNEVMDKLTEIYSQINDRNLDEKAQKTLLAKAHILEDAFEVSENNMLFGSDKQHEIMLNAYYVMNNQELPDEYIELDSKSKRSYKDLKELHDKKKEKAESEYYGYFAETNDKSFISKNK